MQANRNSLPPGPYPWVYCNGKFLPREEAAVPISDRGLRFGDGIFETIRVYQGVAYQLESHIARITHGLQSLAIPYDTTMLATLCGNVITKNMLTDGILRITLTRGPGSKGYLPVGIPAPTIIIEASPLPTHPPALSLWVSSYKKPPGVCFPVDCKTLQGLNSTLARMEAEKEGCEEALLLTTEDKLCEGAGSNLFWVKGRTLFTPHLSLGLLPGIIRETLITHSPFPVQEGAFTLPSLLEADEVFMTNVSWLILPVTTLLPMRIPKAFQELGRSLSGERAERTYKVREHANPEKRRPQLLKGEGYRTWKNTAITHQLHTLLLDHMSDYAAHRHASLA